MKRTAYLFVTLLLASLFALPVSAAETTAGTSDGNDLALKIVICVLIGLVAALVIVLLMKRSMSTVRKQKNAGTYVMRDSFSLTESRDIYLYSTVTRVRVNTNKKRR